MNWKTVILNHDKPIAAAGMRPDVIPATRKAACLAACFFVLALNVGALSVRMTLNPDTLRMGESANLVISVEGVDRGPAPALPEVPGLRISGPAVEQSVSMSLVNGRMQQERTLNYRYTIVPLQSGEYEIGPFRYTHKNETVTIPAKVMRVVASADGSGQDGEPISLSDLVFAEITVDKERVFVHQPFTLTIAVYSRNLNLGRNVSLMNMPESGIQTQPFQEGGTTREVVRNEVYDVRRYQTEIRPLTAGTIRFEPKLRIQVMVPRRRQRRDPFFDDSIFQGLFSNMDAQPFDVTVTPVDVVVRSLPETDRPDSFTGGVGQFQFEAHIRETEAQPGDPLTLTFVIEGKGNLDAVSAPAVSESDRFRVYPPRMTHSDLDQAGQRGRKVFEQIVIPRTAESREVPPIAFSYFDPDTGYYHTITRGPLPLNLREGDPASQRVVRADGVGPDHQARIVGQDIRYLKPAPARWQRVDDTPWFATRGFLAAQIIPLLMGLAVILVARRRHVLDADVARARRYRAPRSARPGLQRAVKALRHNDVDEFYTGIWAAISTYFGDRLNLPPGAITAGEVIPAMREHGLDEENRDLLESVFTACEQNRFSRAGSDPDTMQALLEQTKRLLKNCVRLPS